MRKTAAFIVALVWATQAAAQVCTAPTTYPTSFPTFFATSAPTTYPTVFSTVAATTFATTVATVAPTTGATTGATLVPTRAPTSKPTVAPTTAATTAPTSMATACPPLPVAVILTAPVNGQSVSGPFGVNDNAATSSCKDPTTGLDVGWYDEVYIDGAYVVGSDFNFGTTKTITQNLSLGSHTLQTRVHTSNGQPNPHDCAQSQTVNITRVIATPIPTFTPSPTPTPTATPSPTPTPSATPTPPGVFVPLLDSGSRIASLTGSTSAMQSAGEPGNYGNSTLGPFLTGNNETTPQGQGLIGRPLLDDLQAASLTQIVGYTRNENPSIDIYGTAADNITGDNYYQTAASTGAGQTAYLAELAGYYSGQTDMPSSVAHRVDGACPIVNPTIGEAMQWAALKWGIDYHYLAADACQEGHFDIEHFPGDTGSCGGNFDMWGGCSTGSWQVADRGSNHGWSGLISGAGQNLAAESVCFQADFYMMTRWATFYGVFSDFGSAIPFNLANTVQVWCGLSCSGYSSLMFTNLQNKCWVSGDSGANYGGTQLPPNLPDNTVIPNE